MVGLSLGDVKSAGLADTTTPFWHCRMKRSSCEYDFAGGVSDTDAEGLLETVRQFTVDAKDSIKARDPRLAQ